MKHVHHLSTEKEGKKNYNMPKCIPIDTNQVNPTKRINGWQVLKVDISRYKQLILKMQVCKMAGLRKRKRKGNSMHHLVAREFNIRWDTLFCSDLCTYFSCEKKIGQSCKFWAVALPSTEQIIYTMFKDTMPGTRRNNPLKCASSGEWVNVETLPMKPR